MGNTVSSEQKLDYLKGIFDSVQDDEKMMQEYSCALLRQIHIYGSMYITNKTIYFLSNIVGFKTEEAISLSNVTKITRQYSVGLIPNSIEVVTEDGEKYFFTSFLSRENAYVMLDKVWADAIATKDFNEFFHEDF
ncbi:protein Aster-C-like [Apostichopus japonicus]|uniref:protein Aster-C-like n=1 Tax=Stichopus japonicus TaxID=307972 RepID=UPI003AB6C222